MSHARLALFALLVLVHPLHAQWGTTAFHHSDGVLAVDARGGVIASGGKDAVLRVWKPDGSDAFTSAPDAGWILAVAVSPDAKRIAWGGWTGEVHVVEAGRVRTLVGHKDWVQSLAWSPDGKRLASASRDGEVRVWDLATGRTLARAPAQPVGSGAVAWSADGATLASSSSAGTRLAAASNFGKAKNTFPLHPGGTVAIAFLSPERLLTAGTDGYVACWDTGSHASVWRIHAHPAGVASMSVEPGGARIATCGGDDEVRVFDAATGAARTHFALREGRVHGVAWRDAGRLLFACESGCVVERDATSPADTPHTGLVQALATSPDGKRLAVAWSTRWLSVIDVASPAPPALVGPPELYRALAFVPGTSLIAAGGEGAQVELFDPTAPATPRVLGGHSPWVTALAASPDGKRLASGGGNAQIKVWDLASGKELFALGGHRAAITALAWLPQERILSGSRDRAIGLWSVAERKAIATLKGHTSPVTALEVSPDGATVISTGENGERFRWTPPRDTPVETLPRATSPDPAASRGLVRLAK